MEELSVKKKYYETVSKTIIKNLEKRQIEGYYCPDKELALFKMKKNEEKYTVKYAWQIIS